MIQRILEIIKHKNLTPAQFSEEVGIQRSSISHLISGRNNPSLEFIQKILTTYPEINTEWLMNGSGVMLKGESRSNQYLFTNQINEGDLEISKNDTFQEEIEEQLPLTPQKKIETQKQLKKKVIFSEEKQVEKVVYFYKDQTFREYYPGND